MSWSRGPHDHHLTSSPIAEVEVVLVSPNGTDLPEAVSWDDVVTQPLIMPPTGSGRRELINRHGYQDSWDHPSCFARH